MTENRRFCEDCGTGIGETTNFCPNCGAGQRPNPSMPPDPPLGEPRHISTAEVPGVPPPPPQEQQGNALRNFIVVVIILIVLVAMIRGCSGGSNTASESTAPEKEIAAKEGKKETKQKAKTAPPAEEPEPIALSGGGQMATAPFNLESGLAIFRMTHQGGGNFSSTLLDENGERAGGVGGLDSLLVNVIGPFEGSHAIATENGQHVLDVQADGPWTITIDQPRPSSAPQTTSFSGNSQTATDFFELSQGLKTFNMTHQGGGNFAVTLLDENGQRAGGLGGLESLLVNEIGPFDGSKALRISEEGIYVLQVQADGPWTVQVE